MNCKSVEPLLSLYVGRDLEEERSRLVAAHLQSCTECAFSADEYAEASQLLQGYEPPVFSDEIYAGIRGQVLNEIEREFHAPVLPRIFSQLSLAMVQPRMRWITAALLLAISLTVLYLSRTRLHQGPNDQQVAVRTGELNQAASRADVRSENGNKSAGLSSLSNKEHNRVATKPRPITGKRRVNVVANVSRQSDETRKTNASTNDPVVRRDVDVSQPSSAPAPLRLEMQTSDRNIRIIWLSNQRPRAGGSDGSKGI
jgi:Putative zinc-finger